MDKLIELREKVNKTPEEGLFMVALDKLEGVEKAQPLNRVAVEAALKAVQEAEEKV